jgi:hypothetical protein
MAAIGTAALFGTLVTNISLWLALARGLSLQQAYARLGYELTSPMELFSFGVVLLAGFFGGYIAASHGGGLHTRQALAAGIVATTFFLAMTIGPSGSPPPAWYVALHLISTLLSSLAGGQAYARRSA